MDSNWRAALGHQERRKIVKEIMHTLQKHMPFDGEDGISELMKSAWCIEEKICETARDEQDYLRRISMKMLSLEFKSQTNPKPLNASPRFSASILMQQQQQQQQYLQRLQPQDPQRLQQQYLQYLRLQPQHPQRLQQQHPQRLQPQQLQQHPQHPQQQPNLLKSASPHQFQQQQHMDSNWRAVLGHEARQKIVKRIMDTLHKHIPVSGPDGINELMKIARRFEEKIFQTAADQQDYLRKISMKMLSLESKSQTNPTRINL